MKQTKTALRTVTRLLAAGVLACASLGAQATVITLGGTTVNYTFDDSLLGLFGPASVSGDILYFTPTTFKALSTNGAGNITTSQSLGIQVSAKPGYEFVGLGLLERGDYLLYGPGTNTVNVAGALDITDGTNTFSSALASSLPLDLPGLPTHNWEVSLAADLTGWGPNLDLDLTSSLSASSNTLRGIAFIEQKYAGLSATTAAVPEGNTLLMVLIGLGLLALQLTKATHQSRLTHLKRSPTSNRHQR
jgi:hypothetical protein